MGAKALSIFLLRDQIEWDHLTSLSYLKQLLASGYVFYGGLLCGLTAFFAAGKIHKINARKYAEIIVPCVPLAHGFGRIGCHIAGCCYGIPYDGIGSIVYHAPAYAPIGVPLFPVQLLEAFINFSLAAIFLYMVLRGKRLREMPYIYLGTYAILRFLLEFLRYDDKERGIIGLFSVSQWLSIFILLAVAFICMSRKLIAYKCGATLDNQNRSASRK